jgi:hypothetical protein
MYFEVNKSQPYAILLEFNLISSGKFARRKEGKFPIYFKCQLVVKEVNTHRLSSTKFMIRPPPIQSFNTVKPR